MQHCLPAEAPMEEIKAPCSASITALIMWHKYKQPNRYKKKTSNGIHPSIVEAMLWILEIQIGCTFGFSFLTCTRL